MDNHAVQDMIKEIVETSEFEPLFNYLSDDVVFKVTIPPGTPISGEFRGKQTVIDYFTSIGDIATFRQERIASVDGDPVLGVFNIDRAAARQSVRKQAGLDFEVACFGHGAPIVGGASRRIRGLAESLGTAPH